MKNINKALILFALAATLAFGQSAMTSTTLSSAATVGATTVNVTSASGITGRGTNNAVTTVLFVDSEAMGVISVSGTVVTVQRGFAGTPQTAHVSGATVYYGIPSWFPAGGIYSPGSACTAAAQPVTPIIPLSIGKPMTCANGKWGVLQSTWVDPSNCQFVPTTLTTTNIMTYLGTSGHVVMQGTSNAAAGTQTLSCSINLPTGAQLIDINLFIGSQTTAPTSVGTATLGTVTFPAAATTETASTEAPVTIGGTVTTTTPTALTTVTTAGRFLTVKHVFSTAVTVADRQQLAYQFPILQSAAAAMVLNTPGLLVHYFTPTYQ